MGTLFHSVRLTPDRCKGCVNCIKRCPTEAIRIRSGKAIANEINAEPKPVEQIEW